MSQLTHRVALNYGMRWLRWEAEQGYQYAEAVLAELERLKADTRRIRRYAISKHGTHIWTGRRWRERDSTAERGATGRDGRPPRRSV